MGDGMAAIRRVSGGRSMGSPLRCQTVAPLKQSTRRASVDRRPVPALSKPIEQEREALASSDALEPEETLAVSGHAVLRHRTESGAICVVNRRDWRGWR